MSDNETATASSADKSSDENALPTIADDLVVTKYKMAAEIVNRKFMALCVLIVPFLMKMCWNFRRVERICGVVQGWSFRSRHLRED